jgi:hypothetical protein
MALRHAFVVLLLCALTGVGCLDVDTFDYEEYVQPLDADNELAVSTYPRRCVQGNGDAAQIAAPLMGSRFEPRERTAENDRVMSMVLVVESCRTGIFDVIRFENHRPACANQWPAWVSPR